jgi:uroporphyrinogen-III decarboxylase
MLYCITAKLISRGSAGEIEDKVRDVISKIGPGGGITMYGAMVPKETPPENVHALVRTAKEFGRYPIS